MAAQANHPSVGCGRERLGGLCRPALAGGGAFIALAVLLAHAPSFAGQDTKKPGPDRPAAEDVIRAGDRLNIHATGTLPNSPIHGIFRVEPSGKVALGPPYGRVDIKGLTLEDAERTVQKHLAATLRDVGVGITRYDVLVQGGECDLSRRVRELEKEVKALRSAVRGLKGGR